VPAFLCADLVNRPGAKPLYDFAGILVLAIVPLELPSHLPVVSEEPRVFRNSITGLETLADSLELLQHRPLERPVRRSELPVPVDLLTKRLGKGPAIVGL